MPTKLRRPKASINYIIREHRRIQHEWRQPVGWAPEVSARKILKGDLARMTSLAHCLNRFGKPPTPDEEHGFLVLGWATLGSLIEGYLTFFLALHYDQYAKDPVRNDKGKKVNPEQLGLAQLARFYRDKKVWIDKHAKRFYKLTEQIRNCRNTIHPFVKNKVGSYDQLMSAIGVYRSLLHDMAGQHPPSPEYEAYR